MEQEESNPIPSRSPVSRWSTLSPRKTWFLQILKEWALNCPPARPPEDAPGTVAYEAAARLGIPLAGEGKDGGATRARGRVARRDPSLSVAMWTPTTTVKHLATQVVAASECEPQAPARRDPAADLLNSLGEYGLGGSLCPPMGRSAAPRVEIAKPNWWAVSSVYTRARVALRWKWVVPRRCDPPLSHGIPHAAVKWPHHQESHLPKGVAPAEADLET